MTDVRFITVDNDPGVSVTYAVVQGETPTPVLGHVYREVDSKVWLARPAGRKNPLKTESKTRKDAAALVVEVAADKAARKAARQAEKEAAAAEAASVDVRAEEILDAKDAAEVEADVQTEPEPVEAAEDEGLPALTPTHTSTGTSSTGTVTNVHVSGLPDSVFVTPPPVEDEPVVEPTKPTLREKLRKFFYGY